MKPTFTLKLYKWEDPENKNQDVHSRLFFLVISPLFHERLVNLGKGARKFKKMQRNLTDVIEIAC